MKEIIQSLKFCRAMKMKSHATCNDLGTRRWHTNKFDVFYRRAKALHARQTVILFHGMNRDGCYDQRIMHIARALSRAGVDVCTTHIHSIIQHRVDVGVFAECAQIFRLILEDQEPGCSVSVFAPSYLGSVALQVAAEDEFVGRIKAVCAIGCFFNFDDFFNYALTDRHADPYLVGIFMKNILMQTGQWTLPVQEAFIKVIDCLYREQIDEIAEIDCSALSGQETEYVRHSHDQRYLRHVLNRYREQMVFPRFRLESALKLIKTRVVLIHGDHDSVIPKAHTEQMAKMLDPRQSHILITPVLGHGDHQIKRFQWWHYWRVLKAFRLFFKFSAA